MQQLAEPGPRRGDHDLLAGVEALVVREGPACLLGARIGDGQHAQGTRPDQRGRQPALEQRTLRDVQPGEQDDPLVADRDRRDHFGADRGRGEGRRGQLRDAAREADAESLLDAHREVGVVHRTTTRRSGRATRALSATVRLTRSSLVAATIARAVPMWSSSRTSGCRASPTYTGIPAARVGDTNRPSSLTSTTTTGNPRAAMPSATLYPIEPRPTTMTWSWISLGTVLRPSVWSSRERMSASVMNA